MRSREEKDEGNQGGEAKHTCRTREAKRMSHGDGDGDRLEPKARAVPTRDRCNGRSSRPKTCPPIAAGGRAPKTCPSVSATARWRGGARPADRRPVPL
jgi:hypothetical protein